VTPNINFRDRFGPSRPTPLRLRRTEAVSRSFRSSGPTIATNLIISWGAIRRMGDVLGGVEKSMSPNGCTNRRTTAQGLYIDLNPDGKRQSRDLEAFCAGATMRNGDIGRIDRRNLCGRTVLQNHPSGESGFGFAQPARGCWRCCQKPISARCRSLALINGNQAPHVEQPNASAARPFDRDGSLLGS